MLITQVGDVNRTSTRQQSGNSYAKALQVGAENTVKLEQGTDGRHCADVAQVGHGNVFDALQYGTGHTVLMLALPGDGNDAIIRQSESGSSYSAASLRQVRRWQHASDATCGFRR